MTRPRSGSAVFGTDGRRLPSAAVRGFTLLEAIVVLAIVGALVGAIVPLAFEQVQADRAQRTLERMDVLKRGVIGNPRMVEVGNQETFGFTGDLGQLPDSLEQLRFQDGLSAYTVDPATQLGVGWRGPYLPEEVAEEAESFNRDAFGRELEFSRGDTTVGDVVWAGYVRSAGADGTPGTDDDLVVPVRAEEVRTEVSGFLVHRSGNEIGNAPVGLTFRRDGVLKDTTMFTDAEGLWGAPRVPFGQAFLHTTPGPSGQRMGFIKRLTVVTGNKDQDVEFRLANVTAGDVVITSLTATWSKSGACYRRLIFDGVTVSPTGNVQICSGDTVVFETPVRVPGGANVAGSVTRQKFTVYQYATPAPELEIEGGEGQGEVLVQMQEFRDGGGAVAMTNVTFTVTLSDGLTHTFTTPSS